MLEVIGTILAIVVIFGFGFYFGYRKGWNNCADLVRSWKEIEEK